ncbi:hypothetical protein KEJ23_04635 [Candidatus Bathyarchaeota archaeon]|nr:hypothetical protein [Candidatus Bathyarchaeota archaeon]
MFLGKKVKGKGLQSSRFLLTAMMAVTTPTSPTKAKYGVRSSSLFTGTKTPPTGLGVGVGVGSGHTGSR